MSQRIRYDRLNKLATHLERGKLGHKKFDFSVYHQPNAPSLGPRKPTRREYCGTAGCAIGECPIAFPDDWYFNGRGDPVLRYHSTEYICDDTSRFFGLNELQRRHLFVPNLQVPQVFGGKILRDRASRKDVAKNIRAFVRKMRRAK